MDRELYRIKVLVSKPILVAKAESINHSKENRLAAAFPRLTNRIVPRKRIVFIKLQAWETQYSCLFCDEAYLDSSIAPRRRNRLDNFRSRMNYPRILRDKSRIFQPCRPKVFGDFGCSWTVNTYQCLYQIYQKPLDFKEETSCMGNDL